MTGQCSICLTLLRSPDSSMLGPEGVMHSLSLFSSAVSQHLSSFHTPGNTLGKSLPGSQAGGPPSMPTERHTAQIAMALGLSAQVQAYIAMATVQSVDPAFRQGMLEMRKTLLGLFSVPLSWETEGSTATTPLVPLVKPELSH